MKRFFATSLIFLGFWATSQAQISSDALLLSEKMQSTTARAAGAGGAFGALGGDMSAISINPAGLGIYRSSEIVLSPGLQFTNIKSTFVSDSTRPSSVNNRTSFNLGSVGMVLALESSKDWKNVNFALSYSRLASFNKTFSFVGTSTGSRLINMVQEANNSNTNPDNLDPFEERLAWDAYLIDNPGGGNNYVGAVTDSNYIKKSQFVRQSGGINELGLSLGGNYLNKFYIGSTLGIDFARLRDIRKYSETEETGNIDFKSMQFSEDREVTGLGVNLKIGVIYRATKNLRLGVAVQTPTAYSLTERLNTSLSGSVIWNDTLRTVDNSDPKLSPTAQYKHNFFSPWLFNMSVGITMGKKDAKTKGFIGLDADYLNYGGGTFALKANDTNATTSDQEYINNVNKAIGDQYQDVARVRVGTELAIKTLRLRAGYRLQTSPYQTAIKGVSDFRHDISAGLGIRTEHFFFDVAYTYTLADFEYSPYYATSQFNNPRTVNDLTGGLFLATFGIRF